MKSYSFAGLALTLVLLNACNDPQMQTFSNPNITAGQFVDALNNVDNKPTDPSVLKKEQSLRSGYFVIYDATDDHYRSVSYAYVRAITYQDFYANNQGVAREYRTQELNGILLPDQSERVEYDLDASIAAGYDIYVGRDTGFQYEDEVETTDVNFLQAKHEEKKLIDVATRISFAYELDLKTSVQLAKIGDRIEKTLKKKGELTSSDLAYVNDSFGKLAGVSFSEMSEAVSNGKKEELLEKVADKIGTSATSLQNRILPEMFGLNL